MASIDLPKKTMRGYTYAQWHTSNKKRPKTVPTFERVDKRLVSWGGVTVTRNVWRMVGSENDHEYILVGKYFHHID